MTKNNDKKIAVSPSLLSKLRCDSGFTMARAAKKLGFETKEMKEIEVGNRRLTISQIHELAKIYQRPLAAFFTDAPSMLPKLKDYRINRNKELTPEVYLAERRANYLSRKLAGLSSKKSTIPKYRKKRSADKLAQQFKAHLGVKIIKGMKPDKALDHYKKLLEEKLLVSTIEYPLKSNDVRAFTIVSDISIIVLNEDDKPAIKLFSLFHEVCHLLNRNSVICSIEIESGHNKQQIESYCNRFAAEFLVPENDLKNELIGLEDDLFESIAKLSATYSVSKHVILLRFLTLGFITNNTYRSYREKLESRPVKKDFGKRNWEKVFRNRVGNLIIKWTTDSYSKGSISYSEVIDIMNMKSKYIEKLMR